MTFFYLFSCAPDSPAMADKKELTHLGQRFDLVTAQHNMLSIVVSSVASLVLFCRLKFFFFFFPKSV